MGDTDKNAGHDKIAPSSSDNAAFRPDSIPTSQELDLFRSMVQTVADRYEVLEEIGRGGMGVVYRVRDRETDDMLALKIIRPDLVTDTRLLERFKRELRLARRITHANVCRVHELYRTPVLVFVTMELVEGETLRSVLLRRGRMSLEECIGIARQVCAALAEAHKQGIVHRDLKPENIMLDRSGTVKVMDFGLARSVETVNTLTTGTLGTPAYMSPEQVEGQPVDPRTDIYALGLILYEVFTGVVAFTADTPIALVWKQVHETPLHPRILEPSLSPVLEKTVLKCLEKDPRRRYQCVEEVDKMLEEILKAPTDKTKKLTGSGSRHWFFNAPPGALPRPPRAVAVTLLVLIQILYLSLYLVALAKLETIHIVLNHFLPDTGRLMVEVIRVSALLGIGLRLYLLASAAFDYKGLGNDFRRLSFLLIPLDALWSWSPLLLLAASKIGSLAFACIVALALLPLSQRTVVRMAYTWTDE